MTGKQPMGVDVALFHLRRKGEIPSVSRSRLIRLHFALHAPREEFLDGLGIFS